MKKGYLVISTLLFMMSNFVTGAEDSSRSRAKRQVSKEQIQEALCKDKNPGDYFRLVAGERHCRDVVSCTESGLQAIRFGVVVKLLRLL